LIISSTQTAAASQPIMITISDNMDKVIFDGKWSFMMEWKRSSVNELNYNDGTIELRTAHQGNFIYILVDVLNLSGTAGVDMTIVCFDTKNDKSNLPDSGDYCFGVPFKGKNGFILKGGSPLGYTGHFVEIPNKEGFIGISSMSDDNDRYSSSPHQSYEFRIPIDLLGRSDVYGFYLGVYDSHVKKIYTYPENLTSTSQFGIPSPSQWGEMISPDKSLPEFSVPALALFGALVTVIFITRKAYSFKNLKKQ
jgi:hypothetical protein